MESRFCVSLVLNAHLPFVREFSPHNLAPGSVEENWLFETISETYLPLLEIFDRLDEERIPFHLGISISPLLGQMLCDELLMKKYTAYLDHQIEFGIQEISRLNTQPNLSALADYYYKQLCAKRDAFITRHEGNILKTFNHFRQKGKIEILASPATHAFLPFLCSHPESVQAQLEVAQSYYRYSLGISPHGFWLPDLGWTNELDSILRAYGFSYTIAESHGFIFGDPPPSRCSFYPVKTPQNLFILSRDHNSCAEISSLHKEWVYRDNNRDIGHELPADKISCFLTPKGARCNTGYKYWQSGNNETLYVPPAAKSAAEKSALVFIKNCQERLQAASVHMQETPVSLIAFNADSFGRQWYEGAHFLETLFRLAVNYSELDFVTPSEYLSRLPVNSCEISTPEFSSWGSNGYAETWLDSSNDWIYRHLNRSAERMAELAERFSEDSGLKERALNQAARELLLAQGADWPAMLQRQKNTAYAKSSIENALRNFTTIYEALGSSHIGTEWLTNLEKRHNIFPNINYRVFRRKQ